VARIDLGELELGGEHGGSLRKFARPGEPGEHRVMTKLLILASLALAPPALAGGKEGSVGVGAEVALDNAVGGLSVNYDAGLFHVGGVIGYDREKVGAADATYKFEIGARFYYHVHSAGQADFGIGGEVGIAEVPKGTGHDTHLFIDPSFQVRAFITPNVALSLTAGFVLGTVDANSIAIGGQVTAFAGFHYYFF